MSNPRIYTSPGHPGVRESLTVPAALQKIQAVLSPILDPNEFRILLVVLFLCLVMCAFTFGIVVSRKFSRFQRSRKTWNILVEGEDGVKLKLSFKDSHTKTKTVGWIVALFVKAYNNRPGGRCMDSTVFTYYLSFNGERVRSENIIADELVNWVGGKLVVCKDKHAKKNPLPPPSPIAVTPSAFMSEQAIPSPVSKWIHY